MASFFQNIYLVFPGFSNAEPAHHNVQATGTIRPSEEPIYFYDSHKPYYESAKPSLALPLSPLMHLYLAASSHVTRFTSFSDYPVEYHGLTYPTAEHRTLFAIESN
jgi:hypothetical protein